MNWKLLRNTIVLSTSVIAIGNITPASAADAPETKTPAPKTAEPAKPAIPKPLSAQDLNKELNTVDEYAAILQKAGYTTKVNVEQADKKSLFVSWKDATGAYGVNLTQVTQGENNSLNFVASLSSFEKHPRIPADVFFKLVQAQDATRGWYFVFNRQLKRLFLCRTLSDTKVSSRQLIYELTNLESAARLTAKVWNPAEWITKAAPAPAPAPADK